VRCSISHYCHWWSTGFVGVAHRDVEPFIVTSSDESDRELLERSRKDPEAFGALFERHFDAIFGYVYRRVGNWDAARDLTSETFMKALRSRWRFRWTGSPVVAWLYAIATNEIRMYYRRGARAPLSLDVLMSESGLALPDPQSVDAERQRADEEMERHHDFARVQRALTTLPIIYQDALALRFFEEKSIAEIASILGAREGTVKSRLSRGVARLREVLDADAATPTVNEVSATIRRVAR
jgi:RNA polymerase sigma-70 factor (ECF subfamily)